MALVRVISSDARPAKVLRCLLSARLPLPYEHQRRSWKCVILSLSFNFERYRFDQPNGLSIIIHLRYAISFFPFFSYEDFRSFSFFPWTNQCPPRFLACFGVLTPHLIIVPIGGRRKITHLRLLHVRRLYIEQPAGSVLRCGRPSDARPPSHSPGHLQTMHAGASLAVACVPRPRALRPGINSAGKAEDRIHLAATYERCKESPLSNVRIRTRNGFGPVFTGGKWSPLSSG